MPKKSQINEYSDARLCFMFHTLDSVENSAMALKLNISFQNKSPGAHQIILLIDGPEVFFGNFRVDKFSKKL